jgi:NAD(P)-dependent dehydrogenase (short-subunit alcohol dehydrogenase family)
MMERRFLNKVAIVTGAAGGIGAAIAARLHNEGASVVNADLKADAAQAAAEKLVAVAGGTAIGVACDVGSEEQVEAAVRATLDRFGRIDIIVNNAAS